MKKFGLFFVVSLLNIRLGRGSDNLALLSGTLRTFQEAACDGDGLDLRCPTGTAVSIQVAQYGRVSPDVVVCGSHQLNLASRKLNQTCELTSKMQHALLSTVVAACGKKQMCKVLTSEAKSHEPDPCPNHPKFIEVAFKCRPSEFKNKIVCENETLLLRCKNNERLAIYSANFGRKSSETIHCPQPPGVAEETCQASYATETVMNSCHGKRQCSLSASKATYGSPCQPKSHNYLRVVYTCVSRKILKDRYQGATEADEVDVTNGEEVEAQDSIEFHKPLIPTVQSTQQYQSSGAYENAFSRDEEFPKKVFTEQPDEKSKLQRDWIADGMQGDLPFETSQKKQPVDEQTENVVGYVSGWISTTYSVIKENHEKFVLYLSLSVAFGIVLFLGLMIGRFWHKRRLTRSKKSQSSQNQNTLSTDLSIPGFNDDLLDVDNDIDLTLVPPPTSQDLSSFITISPKMSTLQRQQFGQPRSFARTSNSHLFYG